MKQKSFFRFRHSQQKILRFLIQEHMILRLYGVLRMKSLWMEKERLEARDLRQEKEILL